MQMGVLHHASALSFVMAFPSMPLGRNITWRPCLVFVVVQHSVSHVLLRPKGRLGQGITNDNAEASF